MLNGGVNGNVWVWVLLIFLGFIFIGFMILILGMVVFSIGVR